MNDWAEIRRLHRSEGMPIKVIARVMGCSRNTVRAALRSDAPPRYERPPRGSIVDVVEPAIRELLQAWPTIPATVIAERIAWERSIRVLGDRVAELRPVYLPPDPVSRTSSVAGEIGQCDLWFPPIELPVGLGQTRTAARFAGVGDDHRLRPLAVGVVVAVPAGRGPVRRLVAAARDLGGGTTGVGVGRRGRGRPPSPRRDRADRGDAGVPRDVGRQGDICPPADPEAKGLVERANGYLETSFLPGRTFTSPDDFNAQLAAWTALVNQRTRRALGCAPTDRIDADRAAMLPLPPVAPVTGWRSSLRLARDHYVRLDGNDYSVDPAAIGRRITVTADLDRVRAWCDGAPVADHVRVWARHQTISDPAHVAAARALRAAHQAAATRVTDDGQVALRALSDYDTAFGLDRDLDDGRVA